jgi:tRNA(fMet)-specific endonuclease VapC
MIAYDSDVLSLLLQNNPVYLTRATAYPLVDQKVPVVVAGEVIEGQLKSIRRAMAGQGKVVLPIAFAYLERTLVKLKPFDFLEYSHAVHARFIQLRQNGIRIGISDLRIAATCLTHGIRLVTRNQRDFSTVPGLSIEVW